MAATFNNFCKYVMFDLKNYLQGILCQLTQLKDQGVLIYKLKVWTLCAMSKEIILQNVNNGDQTARTDYVATFGYPGENKDDVFNIDDIDKDLDEGASEAHGRSFNGWDEILKIVSDLSSSLVDLYVSFCEHNECTCTGFPRQNAPFHWNLLKSNDVFLSGTPCTYLII